MANDTPRIIQKDLGLVTAYGYALVGGYEGTEQQFIEDFAKLMQGRMHNDYTFTTIAEMNAAIQAGQIEDGATIYCKEEKGTINNKVRQEDVSDLFESNVCDFKVFETDCGNNTFATVSFRFNTDVVLPRANDGFVMDYPIISALAVDYDTCDFLLPCSNSDSHSTAHIIGFSGENYGWNTLGKEYRNNQNIRPFQWYSTNAETEKVTIHYGLRNFDQDNDITIERTCILIIDHFFISRKSTPIHS